MEKQIKLRFSLAVPADLIICTNGNFIVYVGKFSDGLPDREFELVHVSHVYEQVMIPFINKAA